MATRKSKAPGGARPPVKGGMPQRIYAQASPHSQGGVSLFAGQEQITEHNVEGFCSESDLISRSVSRLREAGFEVLQVSATSINIAGTQAQFEAAFNTRISTDERPVLKSQGVEDTVTFLESNRSAAATTSTRGWSTRRSARGCWTRRGRAWTPRAWANWSKQIPDLTTMRARGGGSIPRPEALHRTPSITRPGWPRRCVVSPDCI